MQVDCQDFLSTSLMQVVEIVPTICSKSVSIKLQQVWFLQTCCNLMNSTDLLQLVNNLQQAIKIHNLQQVSGVSCCVLFKIPAGMFYQIKRSILYPSYELRKKFKINVLKGEKSKA